jgi:transcriptional regulator with GAF, ATPase, and Fis domain
VDDASVSRQHARLEPADGGLFVTDLASHNGTFVGGVRVAERAWAPFDSLVRFGSTVATVVADAGAFASDGPLVRELVGGPGLAELRLRIASIAPSNAPVLIEGETGSGKEVVARAIHEVSKRAGDLLAINCAAIAPELVESELFGHGRGAFSGSHGARAGLFRTADRGTLLLDEIGELRPAVQAKLLRVLETGEVRGVGEDRGTVVDVRVLAATHRDLGSLVATGGFRADLFHRVAAMRVGVPPLRDHIEDLPQLCGRFLRDEGMSVNAQTIEALMLRDWPGNVRELRNVLVDAAAAARYAGRDTIEPQDLGRPASSNRDAGGEESARNRIIAALTSCNGNVTRAAGQLGISRTVLYENLRRLSIDARAYRGR